MEIKGDKVEIYDGPVDRVGGAAPEPEERPVQRTITTDVPVNTVTLTDKDRANKTPFTKLKTFKQTDKVIDGSIKVNMTAGEVANTLSKRCRLCHWWDQEKLRRSMDRMLADTSKFSLPKLNEIRAPLLEHGLADAKTVDAVIKSDLGLCAAFTSIFGEDIIAHFAATCPEHGPKGEPLPSMFRPRSKDASRESDAVRDSILRAAAGKNHK